MKRVSPPLVVAGLALVAALAGTAVAADPVATTSAKKVTKKKVKKIADKIANREIDDRLPWQTDDLADRAVTSAKLAGGAVTTGKLEDSAVTGPKINNGAIGANKLDVPGVKGALGLEFTGRRELNPAPGPAQTTTLLQRSGITIQGKCTNLGGAPAARNAEINIAGSTSDFHQVMRTAMGSVEPGSGQLNPSPTTLTTTGNSTSTLTVQVQGWAWTPSQAIEFSATAGINMQGDGCVFALSATRS